MFNQPDHRYLFSTFVVTRLLGWISVLMGFSLLAPVRAARLFGMGSRPRLMRAIATRDLIIGIGLLYDRRPGFWLRTHALADAIDATFVAYGLLRGTIARLQGWLWLALALGCGAISIARAVQIGQR